MTVDRSFTTTAVWTNDAPDDGVLETNSLHVPHLATLFRPSSDATTPEELLLAAASSCYLITLRTLFENRGVGLTQIELLSEAVVETDHGLRFDSIVHRPTIVLQSGGLGSYTPEDLRRLVAHAEHACMVSSALRGNVDIVVIPTILMQPMASGVKSSIDELQRN